jgi:molecular chaperone DnaK (HSP70)
MSQTVGLSAKQGLVRNAANTVCSVKELIGQSFDSPAVQKASSSSVTVNIAAESSIILNFFLSSDIGHWWKTCV